MSFLKTLYCNPKRVGIDIDLYLLENSSSSGGRSDFLVKCLQHFFKKLLLNFLASRVFCCFAVLPDTLAPLRKQIANFRRNFLNMLKKIGIVSLLNRQHILLRGEGAQVLGG